MLRVVKNLVKFRQVRNSLTFISNIYYLNITNLKLKMNKVQQFSRHFRSNQVLVCTNSR